MTRWRTWMILAGVTGLAACAPKAELVKVSIERARSARQAAQAAGATEKASDLLEYTDDLIEQAEAADRRGNRKQALLAAELAAKKAELARQKAGEAPVSVEGNTP